MKRLFNQKEQYNDEGARYYKLVQHQIQLLVQEGDTRGYSLLDTERILTNAVINHITLARIKRGNHEL